MNTMNELRNKMIDEAKLANVNGGVGEGLGDLPEGTHVEVKEDGTKIYTFPDGSRLISSPAGYSIFVG